MTFDHKVLTWMSKGSVGIENSESGNVIRTSHLVRQAWAKLVLYMVTNAKIHFVEISAKTEHDMASGCPNEMSFLFCV